MQTQGLRRGSVLDYEQSLIFGQYREKLATFAAIQSQKSNRLREERQKTGGDLTKHYRVKHKSRLAQSLINRGLWILQLGGDWILLAVVAIIVASLSFFMDIVIHACFDLRKWLIKNISDLFINQYLIWIAFIMVLAMISTLLVRYVSPQAAGSGVGEMKVVLRGVVLKEYLSFKTLTAKVIGLPFVLGSGIPLGKEGPFVHISAMLVNQLVKLFGPIRSQNEYESRFLDLIAVACAVGVATTFASPVGGVLYSIEIVSVFFSVRSYWMGFFAATIGALFWRLLTVWFQFEDNITHIFKTNFRRDHPYETLELLSFALLGVLSGISGYLFVTLQRSIVLFNRKRSRFHALLQNYPLVYPVLVILIVGLLSFPPGFGQYYGSWMSAEQAMHELFNNETWGLIADQIDTDPIIDNWRTPSTSIYVNTFLFFVMNMLLIALCSTLPVPAGLIVPSFKIGAGLGRFYGEWMAYLFPNGMNPYNNRTDITIIPGAYAVAGSAAFAGANTGAISSAVIIFEVTGQMTHLLPVLVAVIVATLVAQRLGPSIYDSLIKLKKLPYLPPIMSSPLKSHRIFVEDFMVVDMHYIWDGCSYRYLRHLLNSKKHLSVYPFVKSPESMILLGTVERLELESLLDRHLSKDQMIEDLKKTSSKSSLNNNNHNKRPSPTCPIHGSGSGGVGGGVGVGGGPHQRFQVETIPEDQIFEITSVGKHVWEENQLDKTVDFTTCPIEPAPFQLVEGTSLMKAHNLFSLLGLQLAFVTVLGRLIGVVALKEIRTAIEQMHSGDLPRKRTNSSTTSSPPPPENQPLNE
ncbi:chloride channel protein 2-like [Oppia nitens]|uniref:chloride channel protein 2-like n=1 Tax=Oppia nitens TaxID=1686743 RepID=UPI0023DB36F4|nr:chloride channel protein 2-like [Oppia nitens]